MAKRVGSAVTEIKRATQCLLRKPIRWQTSLKRPRPKFRIDIRRGGPAEADGVPASGVAGFRSHR
jgi:hypothetical protein